MGHDISDNMKTTNYSRRKKWQFLNQIPVKCMLTTTKLYFNHLKCSYQNAAMTKQ